MEFQAFVEAVKEDAQQHGVKGQKWGVIRKLTPGGRVVTNHPGAGLVPRTASADQIHTDRIASKIAKGGTSAVSNKDLQDYTRRLQLQQEFKRAAATPEAQKGGTFVGRFLKNQGARQFDRVANKAIDIAVEKAIEQAGVQVTKQGNKEIGNTLGELSVRLKPKKK